MFSKRNQRNSANSNAKFYQAQSNVEELHSGYLYKSPPPSVLSKSLKSWKRRFFVLSRAEGGTHELKYYRNDQKREKPVGEIDLYLITFISLSPDTYSTWEWIQKNFRCSSSCVLYMRSDDREYFLIGENSEEMEGWYSAIFKCMKTRSRSLTGIEENRIRSISEPVKVPLSYDDQDGVADTQRSKNSQAAASSSVRHSAPESYSHYDIPRSYRKTASLVGPISTEKSDDKEEEEEEDEAKISEDSETEDNSSYYMDMGKLTEALSESQSKEEKFLQTKQDMKFKASMDLDHRFEKNQGMKNTCKRSDGEDKACENSFLNNHNSGSTGLSSRIPQQWETHTPVKKDICMTQEELRNSVIFSETEGKPCVSETRQIQSSGLLYEGDQILAINDLLTDSLEEVQTYLRRLSKDQVKLTILRQPGSRPLNGCSA